MKKSLLWGVIALIVPAICTCDKETQTIDDMEFSDEAQFIDKGLQIILTYKGDAFRMKETATFQAISDREKNETDTICLSYIAQQIYNSDKLATKAYNEAMDSLTQQQARDMDLTLKGTTVSYHKTHYEGVSKPIIKRYMHLAYMMQKLADNNSDDNSNTSENTIVIPGVDDSIPGIDDNHNGIENNTNQDDHKIKTYDPEYYESPDGLKIKFAWNQYTIGVHHQFDVSFYVKYTFWGSDTLCMQFNVTDTYENEKYADVQFNMIDLYDLTYYGYSKDGDVITYHDPHEVGQPKTYIKKYFLELQERLLRDQANTLLMKTGHPV
jgi:hypothetical protein